MQRGTIKNLVGDRGFGFIRRDGDADVFFHLSALADGLMFEDLFVGQAVEFELDAKEARPRASVVRAA